MSTLRDVSIKLNLYFLYQLLTDRTSTGGSHGCYLGVTLSNDLEWSKRIATMTNNANSKFSFFLQPEACVRREGPRHNY